MSERQKAREIEKVKRQKCESRKLVRERERVCVCVLEIKGNRCRDNEGSNTGDKKTTKDMFYLTISSMIFNLTTNTGTVSSSGPYHNLMFDIAGKRT